MTELIRVGNRYRLERRIGAGSMGVVWQATDELLGRRVAMKEVLVAPQPTGGPADERDARADDARARIMREGRLAARLQHPHTISVFDVVLHDDRPWLVMELLPSVSLANRLTDGGPLPPREAARIGEQIADGLAAAHAAGIVHRDVKPGNVLITDEGTVKLSDFGVSWAADDVTLTRTGLIQGTPAFLAPEVARGNPPTPASDVFALGATLYTAVEGEPPFGLSDNTLAQLHAVAAGKVRPPSHAGPLTALLMRLLRAEPAERPTAREAEVAFAAIAAGRDPASRAAPTPASTTPPPAAKPPVPGPKPPHPAPADASPARTAAQPAAVAGKPRPESGATGTARLAFWAAGQRSTEDADQEHMPPVRVARRPRIRYGIIAAVLALIVVGGATTLVTIAATNTAPPVPSAPVVAAPTAQTTPRAAPTPQELESFVQRYYSLLPDQVQQAFALLGPDAQRASQGFTGYQTFYAQMAEVSIVDGPQAIGGDVVQATIRFVDKAGITNEERYRFTVRPRADGELEMVNYRRG